MSRILQQQKSKFAGFFQDRERSRRRRLAMVIWNSELALCRELFHAIRHPDCATWSVPLIFEELREWGRSQLSTTIDLLVKSIQYDDTLYIELLAGWVHSRLSTGLSDEATPNDYNPRKVLQCARSRWLEVLKPHVGNEEIQILRQSLDFAISMLTVAPVKHLRVLFIGDCLQFEVLTSLVSPSAAMGISVVTTLVNERVQPSLRNTLCTFAADQFDLIFFSPFSHAYLPEYEVLLKPSSSLWSGSRRSGHIANLLQSLFPTLHLLDSHFQCPVYVHNTGGTVQSFARLSGIAKSLVSWRSRRAARRTINSTLSNYVNEAKFESGIHILDEKSLQIRHSSLALGQVYMNSHAFHPTRLGVELGRGLYCEAVFIAAILMSKKVVICDLDNTLWSGVVGEGEVKQYGDRQAILKGLKERGVLLSINSKNDPNNVLWTDSLLKEEDFVAPQINWDLKSINTARIRDQLNLKVKDFVFLDDRPDELERMKKAFPDIEAMDSTLPRTWNLLSHWQRTLPLTPVEDRTRLYHERTKRDEFIKEIGKSKVEDEVSALLALELSVKIRDVHRKDLKRAAELVNRTNQFNLTGGRTTVRELEQALDQRSAVITAEARDKFGSMGVVAVMRLDFSADRIEIPLFVLSCRVFGYGIEFALLKSISRIASPYEILVGHYKETQVNKPCRQLYSSNGMTWDGVQWIGKISGLCPDPIWLAVDSQIRPRRTVERNS